MVDFFKFITSFTKQLSRPLNDLDDIRFAMTTLIELRNEEIQMDMEVTPIEVYNHYWVLCFFTLVYIINDFIFL